MKGIALKLWIGMLIMVVLMLLLIFLFQVILLEKFYVNKQISEVSRIGETIKTAWAENDQEIIDSAIEELGENYGANVEFINDRGIVTAGNSRPGPDMAMIRKAFWHQMWVEFKKEENFTMRTKQQRLGIEMVMIGMPFIENDDIVGGMVIFLPLSNVSDAVGTLKNQLIYISIIMLIIASIIAFILSKMFTRPVLKIEKAAEEMANGNLLVKLNVKSNDEIGQLAKTMNRLSQQLLKVEELRRDLIANVSHDLRTPLSLIRGYAETIKDVTGEDKEKRERQINIILEESIRLGKIVDDILDYSQMQAGYLKLEKSIFSLNKMFERVILRYEVLQKETEIEINTAIPDNINVNADEARIEQVLYNLINNAFNYSSPGGKISVTVKETGNNVIIKVLDTGTGIPEIELDNIWDKYYKSNSTQKTNKTDSGLGLGLSIVKNILINHKVKFGVESIEGKGTTFWFELEKANQ